jgi:hypothetical protein
MDPDKFVEFLDGNKALIHREWPKFLLVAILSVVGTKFYDAASLQDRDNTIHRLKVALGIDKASDGALIELSNAELKARAASITAKIRALMAEMDDRMKAIDSAHGSAPIDQKQINEAKMSVDNDIGAEFERGLRADTINVDTELRRRLGPKALASVVGISPTLYTAGDHAAVGLMGVMTSAGPGWVAAGLMPVLATGIDQMAAQLPPDAKWWQW